MTDIKTVLTKAADKLEAQPVLWKCGKGPATKGCTCIALAIQDAVPSDGTVEFEFISDKACGLVSAHLRLPPNGPAFFRLADWNDLPETTLEDAVRALRETAEAL